MRRAALPFVVRRENSVVRFNEVTSTRDELFGLLRLAGRRLVVQWRRAREVSQVGREIRTDRELSPTREVAVPLAGLASAAIRWRWRGLLPRLTLVVVAADLSAFDPLAGDADDPELVLEHPGELVLEVRYADRHLARNFASELRLAISEEMLRLLEESERRSEEVLKSPQPLDHDLLAAEESISEQHQIAPPRARAGA